MTRGRRALVCEDDLSIRHMVVTLLRREGFIVDAAADGAEAITRLETDQYELIVLDLAMPHVSGYEVVSYIKSKQPKNLKRILITTAASSAIKEPFPEEICKLLAKPFDLDQFVTYARDCSDDTATRRRRVEASM